MAKNMDVLIVNFFLRCCSQKMLAKNGGIHTPPPPLVSQSQKLTYTPSPLTPAYPPSPLVRNFILMYQFKKKRKYPFKEEVCI